jgi:hypothetical protein
MSEARIYRPASNAMQSGRAKTSRWVMEYAPEAVLRPDSLMGWAGEGSTRNQVRLSFDSLEDATHYAERQGVEYRVIKDQPQRAKPRSYAANFR